MGAHWVLESVRHFSYAAVFLLLLASGLGVPLSEDLIVLTGGMVVAQSGGSLPLMIVTAYFGKLSGDFCLFRIGWALGPRIHHVKRYKKLFTPERVARVDRFFKKWGIFAVFFARFLPGLRAPTYLTAGVSRFSPRRFVGADGAAALISAPLMVYLGYRYGLSVLHVIEDWGLWGLLAIAGIVLIALVVRFLIRRPHPLRSDPRSS